MFPQRPIARLSQSAAQQLRSAPARSTLQRRFNSSTPEVPSWASDNAFNREREAVKHHAASTSGAYFSTVVQLYLWDRGILTNRLCRLVA